MKKLLGGLILFSAVVTLIKGLLVVLVTPNADLGDRGSKIAAQIGVSLLIAALGLALLLPKRKQSVPPDQQRLADYTCSSCRRPVPVTQEDWGKLVECPGCGKPFEAKRRID